MDPKHTIIVSDLHIGSRAFRAEWFNNFLARNQDVDRLILNGDTIDNIRFDSYTEEDWNILEQLAGFASVNRLTVIRGNHEGQISTMQHLPTAILGRLMGVEMLESYDLDVDGRLYYIRHGDVYDKTLKYPWLADSANWCYKCVQRVSRPTAAVLKRVAKRCLGVIRAEHNCVYDHPAKYTGFILGHTHFPADELVDDFHYLNCGSWTDNPCTYVDVNTSLWPVPRLMHYWE